MRAADEGYVCWLGTTVRLRLCHRSVLLNWCSVAKLLALVPSTLIWPLFDRDPLETWVHPSGKVALLGDACHPMLVRLVLIIICYEI
jgi:hypothetical protein